ncbi:type IV secretory system conjugative DNA transfer family protein [Ruminococcus sp. CLA-AA-H200]|uniref:Type IV secretory system conjugative DNA transfer family protein n=2 Tax=Ruminococcus turbiniformis TaxID=2881258 RepID=A0ABS8G1N0_9FIRM|nr:type IV secretory system conjugative DNA transfer family protein [Ruminococcus turbiniformis]
MIGGAGTGKSRMILENILALDTSFVVNDTEGELYRASEAELRSKGYQIRKLNLSDSGPSCGYNPFVYLANEQDVHEFVDCIIECASKTEFQDERLKTASKFLLKACIFYLLEQMGREHSTFQELYQFIREAKESDGTTRLDQLFADGSQWIAKMCYKTFHLMAGDQVDTIAGACLECLGWAADDKMKQLTEKDEMDLDKLRKEKTAVFLSMPQADPSGRLLMSLLYIQLLSCLEREVGEEMEYPVFCIMDNFADFAEIPDFPFRLATLRKYKTSVMILAQSINDFKAYSEHIELLLANISYAVYMGNVDTETEDYFSWMQKNAEGGLPDKKKRLKDLAPGEEIILCEDNQAIIADKY